MLILAGVAASGKTTLAKNMAKEYGLSYVPVEARKCWKCRWPLARQLCFTEEFTRILTRNYGNYAVADNSLLTVYGYTMAMAKKYGNSPSLKHLIRLLRIMVENEHHQHQIIVLTVNRNQLRRRIMARLEEQGDRRHSIVETDIRLHMMAQKAIVELAGKLGIPVVHSLDKDKNPRTH